MFQVMIGNLTWIPRLTVKKFSKYLDNVFKAGKRLTP